jgi:hypothetical protein
MPTSWTIKVPVDDQRLVELLVVAVNAVPVGADTFVEIELWANEKPAWLRTYLRLENGIPSHGVSSPLLPTSIGRKARTGLRHRP